MLCVCRSEAQPSRNGNRACTPVLLQAANERLEQALVEAVRSAAAAGGNDAPAGERSRAGSEDDAVGELSAQLALGRGRLQAAEERVDQLEKLLKVGGGGWRIRGACRCTVQVQTLVIASYSITPSRPGLSAAATMRNAPSCCPAGGRGHGAAQRGAAAGDAGGAPARRGAGALHKLVRCCAANAGRCGSDMRCSFCVCRCTGCTWSWRASRQRRQRCRPKSASCWRLSRRPWTMRPQCGACCRRPMHLLCSKQQPLTTAGSSRHRCSSSSSGLGHPPRTHSSPQLACRMPAPVIRAAAWARRSVQRWAPLCSASTRSSNSWRRSSSRCRRQSCGKRPHLLCRRLACSAHRPTMRMPQCSLRLQATLLGPPPRLPPRLMLRQQVQRRLRPSKAMMQHRQPPARLQMATAGRTHSSSAWQS